MGVREQLLDTADELFYGHGVTATGVDTISARAGVGKMSLYHHFGSKEGLITAYLTRRDERWRAHLDQRLAAAGTDPASRLHAVVTAYQDRVSEPGYRGCSFLNAAAELPGHHPGRRVVAQHKHHVRELLRGDLAATPAADPAGLAAQLFALLEGVLAIAALDPADPDVNLAVARAHRLIDTAAG